MTEKTEAPLPLPLLQQAEQFAIITKMFMRALEGLEPVPNKFENLLNLESDVERARLSRNMDTCQVYFEYLGAIHPEAKTVLGPLVRFRNSYGIPIEGEGRKEYILAKNAEVKRQGDQQSVSISLPQVVTKPQQQQKKHFWNRNQQPQQQVQTQ